MPEGGDDDRRKRSPRINVPQSLSDVTKDVERMEGILRKGLAIVEGLLEEIYTIEWALAGKNPVYVPEAPAPAGPAPAAQNFYIEPLKKGKATVSFGEGKRVSLPPTLAKVIAILASSEDESPDGFVAFKSLDRIGQLLEERFSQDPHRRTYNHHTVLQLLSRLRKSFREAKLDSRLIESKPALGARLRLKRLPAGLGGG